VEQHDEFEQLMGDAAEAVLSALVYAGAVSAVPGLAVYVRALSASAPLRCPCFPPRSCTSGVLAVGAEAENCSQRVPSTLCSMC
jgi:hypothetical protein